MSKVFISYRREDAAGYAQSIFTKLQEDLRWAQIFMDVDTLEPGIDFVKRIEEEVRESNVVIALIGKRWSGERENAPPRIHEVQDFVRLEIEAALSHAIRVIPVLVDGATMPSAEGLPPSLQPLVRRHALELSHTRFRIDLQRVSEAVQKALNGPNVSRNTNRQYRPWILHGGLALVVIAVGIVLGLAASQWIRVTELTETRKIEPSASSQTETVPTKPIPPRQEPAQSEKPQAKREPKIDEAPKAKTPLPPASPQGETGVLKPISPSQKAPSSEKREAKREQIDQETKTKPHVTPGSIFRDRLNSGGEGPEMVIVPAGTFQMGSAEGYSDERPVRAVRIQKPFAVGRYEVTFDDYGRFAKATERRSPDDEKWGRGRRPVINVSWNEAKQYAAWLSEQTGKRYRLPTEAEWEYVARAGTQTAYWWGQDLLKGMANCPGCGSQWDLKQTAPVGSFKPNKFGLYDTAGNVWEWVEDCWHPNYKNAPTDGSAWLEAGGGDCDVRVKRGGSWGGVPVYLRASYRGWDFAGNRGENYGSETGFRLVRDID